MCISSSDSSAGEVKYDSIWPECVQITRPPKCPETFRFKNYYQAIYSAKPLSNTTTLVVKSKGILAKNERKIEVKDFFPYAHCSLLQVGGFGVG